MVTYCLLHIQCLVLLLCYFLLLGASVTLQYPYVKDIPEPSSYEKVTRHTEFGKSSPVNKMTEDAPDLHVSKLLLLPGRLSATIKIIVRNAPNAEKI